jgi:hypothetical protein
MLDDMRTYIKDRIEALSPQGAEDLAATFITMAQAAAEHLSGLATGLMERSAEARAALAREVKDLIAAQIGEMGLATKKELATLRARVDRLEAKGPGAGPKAPSAKKPSGGTRTSRSAGKAATTGKRGAPSATRSVRATPRRPSGAH